MYFIGESANQHAGARIRSIRKLEGACEKEVNTYLTSILRIGIPEDEEKLTSKQRRYKRREDGIVVNSLSNKGYLLRNGVINELHVWELYSYRSPIEYIIQYQPNYSTDGIFLIN